VRLHRQRRTLQPLDEAAAYARCHGDRGVDLIRVERLPPVPPELPELSQEQRPVTGETLRQAFERRLRSR
jgi:hypothetical protein